jgi:general secretion pathway protein J
MMNGAFHRRVRRRRSRGFTLLELIVAIAIGTMVLILAAQVMKAGLDSRARLEQHGSELAALRRTFDMLSRDMHSAVTPPDDSGVQFGLSSTGAGNAGSVLQFASAVGEPLLAGRAASETALIQYGITPDPQSGRPTLWRYETPYPVPAGTTGTPEESSRAIPLLPGVIGATYTFYSEAQQSWLETWDGQTGLPTAIRVDLVVQSADGKGTPRQESWVFDLPAARYANDEAAQAQ